MSWTAVPGAELSCDYTAISLRDMSMCCPVCLRWQLLHICPNQWAIAGLICFYKLIVDLASSSESTRIPGKKLTVVCVGMPVIAVYLSDFIDTPSAALGSRQGRDNYLLFVDEVTEVHWVWGAGTPLCRLQSLRMGADVFSDFLSGLATSASTS